MKRFFNFFTLLSFFIIIISGPTCVTDTDGDGIPDSSDKCPNDPLNDIDQDGICGDQDICPNDNKNICMGCADGTREGFKDISIFPSIAACGPADIYSVVISNSAKTCLAGWHMCNKNDITALPSTLPKPEAFEGAQFAWIDYTDSSTALFGIYNNLTCSGTSPAVANLKGTESCTPSGVYPEGWRLAIGPDLWQSSHATSSGCVQFTSHQCAFKSGTVPVMKNLTACCKDK